jgi:hypothetical protein
MKRLSSVWNLENIKLVKRLIVSVIGTLLGHGDGLRELVESPVVLSVVVIERTRDATVLSLRRFASGLLKSSLRYCGP